MSNSHGSKTRKIFKQRQTITSEQAKYKTSEIRAKWRNIKGIKANWCLSKSRKDLQTTELKVFYIIKCYNKVFRYLGPSELMLSGFFKAVEIFNDASTEAGERPHYRRNKKELLQ